MPKGLFAVVMQYKSDADPNSALGRFSVGSSTAALDSNQAIAGRLQQGGNGASNFFSSQSVYSGTTQGAAAMPESAPLIYPEPEYKLDHEGPETFKDKTRDLKKFMGGYMDRKAQQKYAHENPDSDLVMPGEHRGNSSKYADPNHPMFNGGLIGLVSGGQLSRDKMRDVRNGPQGGNRSRRGSSSSSSSDSSRDSRQRYSQPAPYAPYGGHPDDYRDSKAYYDPRDDRDPRDFRDYRGKERRRDRSRDRKRKEDRGGIGGGVKKDMQEGVLYLMIVNMPSERELEQARRQLGVAPQR